MSTKRPTSEYRFLRCVLTEAEQREYSQRMAQAYQRKIELEASLKAAQSQINGDIANMESEISLCSSRVRDGYEQRSVKCKITYNFDERIMSSVREDTFEIVHEEVIPEALMQTNLVDDGSDGRGENVLEVGEQNEERTAEEIVEGIIGTALSAEASMA